MNKQFIISDINTGVESGGVGIIFLRWAVGRKKRASPLMTVILAMMDESLVRYIHHSTDSRLIVRLLSYHIFPPTSRLQ